MPITLRGHEAKELLLKCLQFILWKQCHWLITEKNLDTELEVIVRNLWRLRFGAFWRDGVDGLPSPAGMDRPLFSSQGEADVENNLFRENGQQKNKLAHPIGELPKLVETLSLCYLGMLLLRLPISLGEVFEWATRNEVLYLRAVSLIYRT